jgi:hypothetical protein
MRDCTVRKTKALFSGAQVDRSSVLYLSASLTSIIEFSVGEQVNLLFYGDCARA